jgi:hypothetical protein
MLKPYDNINRKLKVEEKDIVAKSTRTDTKNSKIRLEIEDCRRRYAKIKIR